MSADFSVRLARGAEDLAGARALRHQVFCVEQGMFADDTDAVDATAVTIVACNSAAGVVGTVRLHSPEPGLWIGSRLAVAPEWRRRAGLGAALIRGAVSTAHGWGCTRFLAQVQARNVAMFEALHWQVLEACTLHGQPHALMRADLDHYPPARDVAAA